MADAGVPPQPGLAGDAEPPRPGPAPDAGTRQARPVPEGGTLRESRAAAEGGTLRESPAVREGGTSRRSPLAGVAGRLAAASAGSGGDVMLTEIPFLTQVNLRLDPKSRAAGDVGLALGAPLPIEPGTSTRAGGLRILWLGPDEWLIVGPDGWAGELETRLRAAAGDEPASVVDVSAQRTTLLVAGGRARDLLAHGCSVDLHPRVFPDGRCAQTMLARAQVVILAFESDAAERDGWAMRAGSVAPAGSAGSVARAGSDAPAGSEAPAGPAFCVLVRSSFAAYLAEWLLDAATENLDRTPP